MSTEQKPATPTPPAPQPKPEPNALAGGLSDAWDKFRSGQLLSYPMMAVLLLVVAGVGGGWWFLHERGKATSARWTGLETKSSVADLEEYAKANPNTIQARLANLEIARIHLGPEGIDRMFVRATDFQQADPLEAEKKSREMRDAAVANVEKAREEFAKLADDFKDDPVIKVECLYACAKAEAVLVGIPKAGQVTERRGDPKKAVEWLDKVADAAPDTEWGKSSKKLADVLRNQNTEQQVATLQASLFDVSPSLPSFPKTPGLPGLSGGFPGLPPGHP
jgi:hypothetical protein